jgi:hypothetical protein
VFFRRCPQCGGEYQYTVSVCADCGCALEDAPVAPQLDATPLPHASQLVPVRAGSPWSIEELAEALRHAGISSRIDSHPPGEPLRGPEHATQYGYSGAMAKVAVYVREQDYEAAQRVDAEVFASRTPHAAVLDAASGDPGVCPGCGTPLSQGAASCAECGLEFPEA